ncbi:hypothetical protein [Shewanella sp. MBTL60-007]|nr:hypothetical protein [Shewanella sp. MBTL60-007]
MGLSEITFTIQLVAQKVLTQHLELGLPGVLIPLDHTSTGVNR